MKIVPPLAKCQPPTSLPFMCPWGNCGNENSFTGLVISEVEETPIFYKQIDQQTRHERQIKLLEKIKSGIIFVWHGSSGNTSRWALNVIFSPLSKQMPSNPFDRVYY